MTFDDFHSLASAASGSRRIVPLYRRRSADLLTPVSAFLKLREASTYPFLLESVEGGEKLARYSFLGRDPVLRMHARGRSIEVERLRDHPLTIDPAAASDPFDVLKQVTEPFEAVRLPELPRFTGGAVGFFGYDAVRTIEELPDEPEDDLGLPDAHWCVYDTVCAFDHVRHQVLLITHAFIDEETDLREAFDAATGRLDALERDLTSTETPHPAPIRLDATSTQSNVSKERFCESVERAREHIREGDIFQLVLSQRFAWPYEGDRFNCYRALRQVNPSPYLFFLDTDEFALAGSSPEVLVRVEDERAELLPIAGTRPRGADHDEDLQLEEDLAADPKERAEHLMLVDLGRNDLGRIARYGSVSVDRYAFVERYSHVMHLVSSVSAEVREQLHAADVLRACFPAGTVSGAPKVRAMELIDRYETTKRGVYAGALGYLDFGGNMDTCITIRTMLARRDTLYVQAGAGIVADSDPEREYEETVNKARALKEALRIAADGLI